MSEPARQPTSVKDASMRQALRPSSKVLHVEEGLVLTSGQRLAPLQIAYQAYGTLNAERSNAVLVCHALTGDQHAASVHPVTGKPGWWGGAIGPGLAVDTNRFFVVCANVLGSCLGTTGPASQKPGMDEPYGLDFPVVTIADMVEAQRLLIDGLGIDTLFAVIGGSMGGMQVLQWMASHPTRLHAAMPIATAARHSAQNIAFHEVGRQAVMADPAWHGGRYAAFGTAPRKGLGVARMAAHVTYLSQTALARKFGRGLQDREAPSFGFDADFQVESYLRHQGVTFVERFDANAYLYLTRAMDYFDLAADAGGKLSDAFRGIEARVCVVSFSSDWLFTTEDARQLVHALNASGANVSFVDIESDKGHDAFLLDEPEFDDVMRGFLDGAARAVGLEAVR